MKVKFMRIVTCILLVGIIFRMIICSGKLLNPRWTDRSINAVEAFHSLPENSIEVLIYGSSHAWKGIDPRVMYEQYGIKTYNYSGNWQKINTTALFFKDSIRTQSPKIILIETFLVSSVLKDSDLNGEIYYTKAIDMFDGKIQYLKQCFGNDKVRWLSYYFPLIMFHSNWNSIDEENFAEGVTQEQYLEQLGYERGNSIEPVEIMDFEEFEQYELDDEAVIVLDDIVKICKEQDIKIIFYTVPYQGEFGYYKAMKDYAVANGCVYLNLFQNMEEIGIDETTDFRDATHLNDNGAKKIASYLGKYIIDNFNV